MSNETAPEELTRAEETLLIVLGLATVQRCGRLSSERSQPPTEKQFSELRNMCERVLADLILTLRAEGPRATPGEIAATVDAMAVACFETIMGPPAGKEVRPS